MTHIAVIETTEQMRTKSLFLSSQSLLIKVPRVRVTLQSTENSSTPGWNQNKQTNKEIWVSFYLSALLYVMTP